MTSKVQGETMVLEGLTQSQFSDYLGNAFRLESNAEHQMVLQLIEAKHLSSGQNTNPKNKRPEPFSLVFRGPQELPLDQATYQLQHDQLGELHLFLVPIDQDEEGFYYEAIFN